MIDQEGTVLYELILQLLDGTIGDEELSRLDNELADNPEALRGYFEFMMSHAALRHHIGVSAAPDGLTRESGSSDYEDLLRLLGQMERTAPAVEIPRQPEVNNESIEPKRSSNSPIRASKIWAYVALTALAMLFVLFMPGYLSSLRSPVVATLTDGVDVAWAQGDAPVAIGDGLRAGPRRLLGGFAEITFAGGARAVLQAPVEFEIEARDRMSCRSGRLVAKATKQAVGFTVRTPGATVVDYGTEFGVLVHRSGGTAAHVFEGRVQISSHSSTRGTNKLQSLMAGQACAVDREGNVSMTAGAAQPGLFQRYVPSPYELAVRKCRPLAYWRLDPDDRKGLVNVIIPDANSASFVGPVQFTPGPGPAGGRKALALQLDGRGGYAVIPSMVAPNAVAARGYTYVMWVRPDLVRAQDIFGSSFGDGSADLVLAMTADGRFHHFQIGANARVVGPAFSKTIAQAGKWYHVAIARGAYEDRRVFVNGVEEASGEASSYDYSVGPVYPRLRLGTVTGGPSIAGEAPFFKGAVSDVAVYNRALTPDEIYELYISASRSDK